jgi:P-type E1-E2 ATPase
MMQISIPGRAEFRFDWLVLDLNGTLALDGAIIDGVAERLAHLREGLLIVLLTADTHGTAEGVAAELQMDLHRLQPGRETEQKLVYVQGLGADRVIAVGNGANDAAMLREAGLGVCVLGGEGSAVEALGAADIVVPDILTALDLIARPRRLCATLRQ